MSDKNWEEIGTVIGSTSTDSYGFLLSSLKASVGDIVITEAEIPSPERGSKKVFIWELHENSALKALDSKMKHPTQFYINKSEFQSL